MYIKECTSTDIYNKIKSYKSSVSQILQIYQVIQIYLKFYIQFLHSAKVFVKVAISKFAVTMKTFSLVEYIQIMYFIGHVICASKKFVSLFSLIW